MDNMTDTERIIPSDGGATAEMSEEVVVYAETEETADKIDTVKEGVTADQDPAGATAETTDVPTVDYEALAAADLAEIRRLVPGLSHIGHLGEIPGATRYAELRDMGLGVEEAFWAACHGAVGRTQPRYDNRSHLHSAVPRGASGNPAVMTAAEMSAARELFEDLSESEIQKLYAKCRA